jgi:mandelamide amidase
MHGIVDFLRKQDVGVSFEQIHNELRPQIKETWDQFVLPEGPGFLSQDAYIRTLTVDLPEVRRRLEAVFLEQGADAFIFPTTPCPAPLIEQQVRFKVGDTEADYLILAKNTLPTNAAGLPGISIPTGLSAAGLPVGLEIDAARNRDRHLLALAQRVHKILGVVPTLP